MSREFGEYDGGYFHTKLQRCCEDAEAGRTDGAKVIAALLNPLADMAYAVSSEEACDSGPDGTVQTFAESAPALRSAMHALEAFTEPARDYAASVLAGVIRPFVTLMPTASKDEWTVRVHRRGELPPHEYDVFQKALAEIVRKEKHVNGYFSGSSSNSNTEHTDYHFCAWNSKGRENWLSREVHRLEAEVELLRAKLANVTDLERTE